MNEFWRTWGNNVDFAGMDGILTGTVIALDDRVVLTFAAIAVGKMHDA